MRERRRGNDREKERTREKRHSFARDSRIVIREREELEKEGREISSRWEK